MRTYLLVLAGLSASQAQASFYPPDYVIEQHCQESDAVKVCVMNRQYGRYPRLRIEYKGALAGEGLSAFVRMNGKSQSFLLDSYAGINSISLGDPSAVRLCVAGPKGKDDETLPPSSRACQHTLEPAGSTVWEADPVPSAELDLFTYAYDGYRANAWDIELAFFDRNGAWDSRFGQNYSFRFE